MRLYQVCKCFFVFLFLYSYHSLLGQDIKWDAGGNAFFQIQNGHILKVNLPSQNSEVFVSSMYLTPNGQNALSVRDFTFS